MGDAQLGSPDPGVLDEYRTHGAPRGVGTEGAVQSSQSPTHPVNPSTDDSLLTPAGCNESEHQACPADADYTAGHDLDVAILHQAHPDADFIAGGDLDEAVSETSGNPASPASGTCPKSVLQSESFGTRPESDQSAASALQAARKAAAQKRQAAAEPAKSRGLLCRVMYRCSRAKRENIGSDLS